MKKTILLLVVLGIFSCLIGGGVSLADQAEKAKPPVLLQLYRDYEIGTTATAVTFTIPASKVTDNMLKTGWETTDRATFFNPAFPMVKTTVNFFMYAPMGGMASAGGFPATGLELLYDQNHQVVLAYKFYFESESWIQGYLWIKQIYGNDIRFIITAMQEYPRIANYGTRVDVFTLADNAPVIYGGYAVKNTDPQGHVYFTLPILEVLFP